MSADIILTKICKKCGNKKNIHEFHLHKECSDGHRNICKACISIQYKERIKRNPEKSNLRHKKYYEKNKDKVKKYFKEYYKKNKKKLLDYQREYSQKNRAKRSSQVRNSRLKKIEEYRKYTREYESRRKKEDVNYRLRRALRNNIKSAIRYRTGIKKDELLNLIGCSIHELKIHLEKKFKPGMSWNNYGQFGWHIDHIKPCAFFDLTDPEQQKKCFHYTNLQPLWWMENLSKKDKII